MQSLFGLSMTQRRFYTFMASPKIQWQRIWHSLWRRIPEPFTDADVRRSIADTIAKQGFDIGCPEVTKPERKSLLSTFMRLVA